MDTPLEESNLAGIGSDEDKKLREAAAKLELNWEGAGAEVGIQVWRVENRRTDDDVPVFGINEWPESRYGEFYRGDSFIVLQTRKDDEGSLFWDIYFWIGSESSQDEYGVAAYKANELDDLLGDKPIQHREVEKYESPAFRACFGSKGIKYLDGGIASGFRFVGADSNEDQLDDDVPDRLFQVIRKDNVTTCHEVPCESSSLNDGDAFILDIGDKVFTWFGSTVSPFEKNKSADVAQRITDSRGGHCEMFVDVGDDNDDFWSRLGGKGDIAPASDDAEPEPQGSKMYVVTDEGGKISVKSVDSDRGNLDSGNVCLIDMGHAAIVWIGSGSSKSEQQQAMIITNATLRHFERENSTTIYRIMEGQESRCPIFDQAF